jgi:hypothetical protein
MKHASILTLGLALVLAAGCDQDSNSYGDTGTDPSTETPTDTTGDTATDPPVDNPVDTPVDTTTDAPADTPVDTPADTPVDTPADEGASDEITHFCNVACIQCFGGTSPWNHQPAEDCIPECIADFSNCSATDTAGAITCPGGDDCPAGVWGTATCLADYTCLLEP